MTSSATCTACGAPIDGTSCGYCGETVVPPVPTAVPGTPASAADACGGPCPRCDGTTLQARKFNGLTFASCHGCKGIWVGREQLEDLLQRQAEKGGKTSKGNTSAQSAFSSKVEYLRCPACRGLMNRENFRKVSGVIIDVCKDHGVWLDGGELQALQRFAAEGGFEKAAASRAHDTRQPAEPPPLPRAMAVGHHDLRTDVRSLGDSLFDFFFD
ncbi:MAG: zf-TFIIB domain-containing protein [Acidobacteriota bacterium]